MALRPIPFWQSVSIISMNEGSVDVNYGSNAFMIFWNLDMPYNKAVNQAASTTFAVYLIHDNNLYRSFWWEQLFHGNLYQDSNILLPYSVFAVILLFVLSVVTNLLRHYLFKLFVSKKDLNKVLFAC